MSYIVADRVKESSTIVGTGTISLLGAAVGFRTFASQMSVGDTCSYVIANTTGSEWEVGIATYSSANTLTRTTVQSSTNANAVVNFSAGLKDVFISPTAQSVIDYNPITHQISNASWNGDVVDVSKGGTGVTTATGTGSVVRSTAPTLTTATFAAGTISASAPNTITQTWNNAAVTFSALTVNVTDVASGTGSTNQLSRMLDLQKGGSSLLRFDSKGTLVFGQGNSWATAATGEVAVANEGGRFTFSGPSNARYVGIGSGSWGSGLLIRSSSWLGFHSDDTLSNFYSDTTIYRDAAGTLAQRNGTNPQAFRVYNTYTSASVYERASLSWASNVCTLTTESTTAGAGRNLVISAGNGVTSGAGGSLILQAGIQATSGGDGKVVVKQAVGQSAYFFELQNSAGTAFFITSTDANANIFPTFGSASTSRVNFVVAMGSNVKLGSTHINYSTYASKDYGFATSGSYYWAPVVANTQVETNVDLALNRDAADTLAQRRSTNAQTFRLYNTYTDASNYERLGLTWASNVCTIGLAQAGTGATRNLVIAGATATTGAGGNVTITAGSGSGVGAGGNIILQPGAQGTSGGNGSVQTAGLLTVLNTVSSAQNTSTNAKFFVINDVANYSISEWNGAAVSRHFITPRSYLDGQGGNVGLGAEIQWGASDVTAPSSTKVLRLARATLGVLSVNAQSNGGSISFPSVTTAFSANTNDLALTASAFQRINCTVASSLTGIAPPTSGIHVDGRMIRVYNVGTANLTLAHNSTSSTAANRFYNATGADIVLAPNDYAELIYDSTSNGSGAAGWRVS